MYVTWRECTRVRNACIDVEDVEQLAARYGEKSEAKRGIIGPLINHYRRRGVGRFMGTLKENLLSLMALLHFTCKIDHIGRYLKAHLVSSI